LHGSQSGKDERLATPNHIIISEYKSSDVINNILTCQDGTLILIMLMLEMMSSIPLSQSYQLFYLILSNLISLFYIVNGSLYLIFILSV
jgi:hypothetical protein